MDFIWLKVLRNSCTDPYLFIASMLKASAQSLAINDLAPMVASLKSALITTG